MITDFAGAVNALKAKSLIKKDGGRCPYSQLRFRYHLGRRYPEPALHIGPAAVQQLFMNYPYNNRFFGSCQRLESKNLKSRAIGALAPFI